jgi:FkbM family methyltransferase
LALYPPYGKHHYKWVGLHSRLEALSVFTRGMMQPMTVSECHSAAEVTNALSDCLLHAITELRSCENLSCEELMERARLLSRLVLQCVDLGSERGQDLLTRLRKNPLAAPVPGGRTRLDFEWAGRDLKILAGRGWDASYLWLMKSLLRPGGVVMDVGAHIGHYTIFAASLVGAGGSVYSFEPAPANYHRLCENIRLNGFSAHVQALPVAVSDRQGMATFYDDGGTAGTEYSMFPQHHGERGVAFSAETRTLDGVASERKVDRVDFIKVDAEGAELAILQGAEAVVEQNPHVIFLVELHPWAVDPQAVCSYLAQHQMRLYDINRGMVMFGAQEARSRFASGGDILATRADMATSILQPA